MHRRLHCIMQLFGIIGRLLLLLGALMLQLVHCQYGAEVDCGSFCCKYGTCKREMIHGSYEIKSRYCRSHGPCFPDDLDLPMKCLKPCFPELQRVRESSDYGTAPEGK
mmetsp:Transcript_18934/g.54278  ORF Transcript_18934/g.54278 Transcript_18934/m.54278 type:complete len:108 (-) Transcript_18934:69-392(-)